MSQIVFINLITINQYFDQTEFEVSPIKTELKSSYFSLKLNQSFVKDLFYSKKLLTTYDNWLSSTFGVKDYQFLELKEGSSSVGEIIPSKYEMFQVFINKYEQEEII